MKDPIILTKTNQENQVIEAKAYHLQNLDVVSGFTNLCRLELVGGKIFDFYDLKDMENLYELKIGFTEIRDFSSIISLGQIRELSIAGSQESMITVISKMRNLRQLRLMFCKIDSLEGLGEMQNLKALFLGNMGENCDLSEIMKLKKLTRLQLTIPGNYMQSKADILLELLSENLPNLNWLEVDMMGKEFHPHTLRNLSLRHLAVTGKPFCLAEGSGGCR